MATCSECDDDVSCDDCDKCDDCCECGDWGGRNSTVRRRRANR